MATIHPDESKRLSALSILNAKGTNLFHFHVVTDNGELTSAQTRVLADIAEQYGSGVLSFSAQSSVTIHGIPHEHIDTVLALLDQVNLMTGGTGARIHPIIACRGTNCRFGLCDTLSLYRKIHQQLYLKYQRIELPHKLKISVGGCPNNCAKANLSDIGVMGQAVPALNSANCQNCTNCSVVSICPMNAADRTTGKVQIDTDLCTHCGQCASKCPFGAVYSKQKGAAIYIGGRSGKKITLGTPLHKVFSTEDEVIMVIERAILLYQQQGFRGERFADTIDRLGFDAVQQQLLGAQKE